MDPATRNKNMAHVSRFLTAKVWSSVEGGWLHERLKGRFVVSLFLCTKLLFIFNAIVQFLVLKAFLGIEGFDWGWGLINQDWHLTGKFPRVTLCDFEVP